MLLHGLPQSGPHTKHLADGREWSSDLDMMWALVWEVMRGNVIAARAAGSKDADLPSEQRPRFPWSVEDSRNTRFGDLGDLDPELVLDYLDSL